MRLFAILLLGIPTLSSANGIKGDLQIESTTWTASCQNPQNSDLLNCTTPQPYTDSSNFVMTLAEVNVPGHAGQVFKDFKFGEIQGRLTLFSVFPEQNNPPYIQIRTEMSSPIKAICIQSVQWKENFQAPPSTCAGFNSSNLKEFGFNLKIHSK